MSELWDDHEVIGVVSSLINDNPFRLRDTEYINRRELLYQKRNVVIPGVNLKLQFRSPEIEDDANAFKNRMLAAPFKCDVAATKNTEDAKAAAQRQQNFFYRHFKRWKDQRIFDKAIFDQMSLGIGWLHLALNTEILPLVPDYQDGEDTDSYMEASQELLKQFTSGEKSDLFILNYTDAATMYWSPAMDIRVQAAVVPLNPLARMYAEKGKQLTYDDKSNGITAVSTIQPGQNIYTYRTFWNRMVNLYTVETPDYCYHIAFDRFYTPGTDIPFEGKGVLLGAYKNYFGTPGFIPVVGEETGSSDPFLAYRPPLNGKYQTVPVKNILTNAMMTAGVDASQQRYAIEWIGQGPPPDDDANVTVTVTADGVIVPPIGYKLVNSGLAVGIDLMQALTTMEKMDTYGYPKALNRPEEVTASSGYDRARQQDAVASLLDPPLGHFGAACVEIFKALAHAVKEIGMDVTVRNVKAASGGRMQSVNETTTLKPDDMDDDTDIAVEFDSVTVFSRVAMSEEGLKQMQADQLSETQYQTEIMGVEDIQEWRDQRALDKVLKNADDRAVAAVNQVIDTIAANVAQQAVQKASMPPDALPPPAADAGAMVETNGGMIRADRGPGQPTGAPGSAMPAVGPPPPLQANGAAPATLRGV